MSLFTEDDILHSLLQGDWLFSNLIPSFRSKLEQVLFVKDGQVRTNWSLFLLTSLVYRKENLSTDLIVQFSDPAKNLLLNDYHLLQTLLRMLFGKMLLRLFNQAHLHVQCQIRI